MADRLRIAQVAPVALPVARDVGSSIEQLTWLLTEELVDRGHEVTLFATADSSTSAALHATYERGYDRARDLWNWELAEVLNHAAAYERADEFDVIHSHAYHFGLPFARLAAATTVHTYHVNPNRDVLRAYATRPQAQLVAVSSYHRSKFRGIDDVPVIHNGVDTASLRFSATPGGYLLFLGHLIPKKDPVGAIQVARSAGMRIVLAGHAGDGRYFQEQVEPLLEGGQVDYVGPVERAERDALLAGAGALVLPIAFSEPFGLVFLEAMACGTPVLALDKCAVAEIVEPGVTGHYAGDLESLAALVPATLDLDRTRVRERVVARFDHRRMVGEYEALYERLLAGDAPRRAGALARAH